MDEHTFDNWKQKDKLGISEKIKGFAQIIRHTQEAKVYSITAPFGIGKSFFCEGLEVFLNNQGIPCIRYNVWEVDFYQNPLTPLICEISEKLKSIYETKESQTAILNKFMETAEKIIAATTIRFPGISVNCKEVLKAGDEKNDLPQICENYKEYRETVKQFKSTLQEIAAYNQPLVIIIDELDRCRPDYAVEVLETIKHLLEIPGVVFVLSIDENQLQSSVRQLYGQLNFKEYMRKFVNYSFALPKPDPEKYIAYLSAEHGLEPLLHRFSDIEHCLQMNKDSASVAQIINIAFAAYSCLFNFSLRAQNQVMQRLVLFLKSLDSQKTFYPELAIFLACVREYDKALYEKLKNGYGKGNVLAHIRQYIGTDKNFDENKFNLLNKKIKTVYYYDFGKYHEYDSCDIFMQAIRELNYSSPNELEEIARSLHLYTTENRPQNYFDKMDFIDSFLETNDTNPSVAAE